MRSSRTAHAVFAKDSGLLVAANDALDKLITEHQIITTRSLFKDYPEILAQVQKCQQDLRPTTLAHAPSLLDFEFLPLVGEGGELLAVQALATPRPHDTAAQEDRLEKRFQTALEKFPLNAWMCSQQGEMFWRNHTGNRFTHSADVVHDQSRTHWISSFHPDDLPEANQTFAKAMADGVVRPFRYRLKNGDDGDYHWHLSNYTPIRNAQGVIEYWVGTGINIQSFVDAEERLKAEVQTLKAHQGHDQRLLKDANDMLAKAQKMELVNQLAGGVAHDLNNLLFIMSLNADLLFKQLPDGVLRESANCVRAQIKKAARLSSQLMGFSGRKPQSVTAVDPKSLLDEIGDLLQKAVGAETHFDVQIDNNVDRVLVDKMYLENSLVNLAINARDAVAGRGTITLSVSNARLQLPGHADGFVVFKMRDDGSGMSPDVLERIYEPFFTTKAPHQGTGLGIPMVKNFVESSGGFMDVESAPGIGTIVSLYLPMSTQEVVEMRPEDSSAAPLTSASLLIIDDDAGVRDALTTALNGVGYQNIVTAYNSEYAIQFLQQGMAVDLIISDIRMPGNMRIAEFLRQLDAMHRDIPVIFATGYSEDVVIENGLVEGKHPVLFKPFTLEDLFARIRETMPERLHH
ncbi:response regulator [Diaphorobacter sp. HDW4B]|uniref:hybrid sensor histidine kinase/response regulator n=1 Tax=Diaphorobacter sp. HDW4B TaxID=2714925 RepID=UPI00140C4AFF|nr:hybrid sensor histidine kinase/response regulator [Diaphorobacter sp. HDW4B]QIL72136.1 response regulator [Diaphorobacter sp. HDW4B]